MYPFRPPKQQRSAFAACRPPDDSTAIACANGDRIVVFDANYRLTWHVTSAEVGGLLNDACGLHVLKSGNFLVAACASLLHLSSRTLPQAR